MNKPPIIGGWTLGSIVEVMVCDERVTGRVQDVLQGMGTKHVGGSRRRIVLVVGWYDVEGKRSVYDYFEPRQILRILPEREAERWRQNQLDDAVRRTWENDPILARLQRPGPKLIQ